MRAAGKRRPGANRGDRMDTPVPYEVVVERGALAAAVDSTYRLTDFPVHAILSTPIGYLDLLEAFAGARSRTIRGVCAFRNEQTGRRGLSRCSFARRAAGSRGFLR